MTLYQGLGDCGLRTTDITGGPNAQKLVPFPVFSFDLAQDSTVEEALAYRAGRHQVEDSFEGLVNTTLTLSTEINNWQILGLSRGLLQRTLTDFVLPVVKRGVVPSAAPYEIVDTELTATAAAKTLVAIESYGPWGQANSLSRVTTVPTTGQVQVDATATKLVFHASQAGAPIMYVIDRTFASGSVYGGAGTLPKINEVEFFGQIYDNSSEAEDGGLIWVPRMKRASRPNLTFDGGKPTIEVQYKCLSVAGWEEPFQIVDGHSVAA
jgi:hypothetical protein